MYKYNVKIQKVSGRLNESVLPSKSLVVKSKTKKSDKEVFAEASKYFKNKYGLVIEMAEISPESSKFDVNELQSVAEEILSNPSVVRNLYKTSSTYIEDRTERVAKMMAKEMCVKFSSLTLDEYKLFKQIAKSALAKYE